MAVLRFIALSLLAVWAGGLAVLGAIVAPLLFRVLEARDGLAGRDLAGQIFGTVFARFQLISLVVGGVLVLILGVRTALGPRPRRLALRLNTLIVMVAITAASITLLSPRIDRLRREAPGPIAGLAADDPRRVEFGRLHGLSTILMMVTMVGGAGLLWREAQDPH